jgi:PAS domain S-box-containing protein
VSARPNDEARPAEVAEEGDGAAPGEREPEILAQAFAASPLALVILDAATAIRSANPSASHLFGYSAEHLVGRSLEELAQESQRMEVGSLVRSARAGETPARREMRFLRPDGSVRLGGLSLSRMVVPGKAAGVPDDVFVLAVIRDVTEERGVYDSLVAAEKAAHRQLEREASQRKLEEGTRLRAEAGLRQLIETVPDLVIIHRNGRILWVNEVTLRALDHVSGSDLVGRLMIDVLHPQDRKSVTARSASPADDGSVGGAEVSRILRRDGSYGEVEFVAIPVPFEGAPAVLALGRDLTERKSLEAKLALSERLVAIGTLAAGIAHEINNPLTYVLTNLLLLEEAFDGPGAHSPKDIPELAEMLHECREGAERISKIVRGLKGLSRGDEEAAAPLAIETVVEQAITMTLNEVRHRARLVKDYQPTPLVKATEVRLVQVFINLLVNAAQAIPEGRVQDNEIRVTTGTDEAGRARIAIEDTGSGIAAEHLRRVFDPFFTLKPVGVGTGLGLSISQGIVSAAGGSMSIDSVVGRGTRVEVLLPAAASERARLPASTRVPSHGAGGRVLIIDDEPAILASLSRALSSEHDVTAARSGSEALALLRNGERFHVILCDLMMPDVTGMEVHAALLTLAPEQAERMVFISGGAFTPQARSFLESTTNECLDKPLDNALVRGVVRRFAATQ